MSIGNWHFPKKKTPPFPWNTQEQTVFHQKQTEKHTKKTKNYENNTIKTKDKLK